MYVRVMDDHESEGEDAGLYKCQVQVNGENIGTLTTFWSAWTVWMWGEQASDEAGDAFFEAGEGGGMMLGD
jgi:hypothetical protein